MTAKEVRESRELLGLTQEKLARKINRTTKTIANWENYGITKIKDRDAIVKLVNDKLAAAAK